MSGDDEDEHMSQASSTTSVDSDDSFDMPNGIDSGELKRGEHLPCSTVVTWSILHAYCGLIACLVYGKCPWNKAKPPAMFWDSAMKQVFKLGRLSSGRGLFDPSECMHIDLSIPYQSYSSIAPEGVIHEAEYRLFRIQRKHNLSLSVMNDIIEFGRFTQAESARAFGVPPAELPQYVPLRKSSAKTVRKNALANEKHMVWP